MGNWRDAVAWALVLSALAHVPVQLARAYRTGRWGARQAGWIPMPNPNGSASLTGCYLAIALFLAPWPVTLVLGLGLYLSHSWLALVALCVAMPVYWAGAMGWVPIAALGVILTLWWASKRRPGGWRVFEYLPRGDSWDPIAQRLLTWRVILRTWRAQPRLLLWGRGWGQCGRDLRAYRAATHEAVNDSHAFNEYLEVGYDLGLAGWLGIALWAGVVGAHLHRHDPWSAALVVWAVTMCGSTTLRVTPFWLVGALCTAMVVTG